MPGAFFITGTDTDAGKTVVTAGLLRAFAGAGIAAKAVKPVQTGCTGPEGARTAPDAEACILAGGRAEALRLYRVPCSPHLAARFEGGRIEAAALADECRAAALADGITLYEGAGGPYVPLNDAEYMLDLMRELRLPVLLVVGNRLGCISHALMALDVLENAGLIVAGMVLCRTVPPEKADPGTSPEAEAVILGGNAERLAEEGLRRGIPLLADIPWIDGFDPKSEACWDAVAGRLAGAAKALAGHPSVPEPRFFGGTSEELIAFDKAHIWHPYTSAMKPLRAHEAVGAKGATLFLRDAELTDGMSSWWCRVHGYGDRRIIGAVQRQAARLSHIMFGGITHDPAAGLVKRLLGLMPAGLEHVFLADSGSVAVEVAMKMALQYAQASGRPERSRFIALRGAYHGDTIGAMSLCDPVTGMHSLFSGVLPKQIFVERPSCRFDAPFDPASFRPMEEALRTHADEAAAVVVEPVVQGAGGMWFYHPQYLARLRRLCSELGVLLITDEIATGFGRTGRMFACEWAGITPDILCCGKALTGGMMTLSAVAATRRVAEVISGADAEHGGGLFMHGPTFMGNPLACAAACASLDALAASPWKERVARIESLLREGLEPCRGIPGVRDVRVLGAIGVVQTEKPVCVEAWQDFFIRRGVWIRPFGTSVYVMPPFVASDEEVRKLASALCAAAASAAENGGTPV